jgi:hypothetical protein
MRPNTRRIEDLERRAEALAPEVRGEVRARMGEQLARLAAVRRGLLDAEEEAEVRAFWTAFERRAAEARGGGR